jgi:hypothetical protein
VQQPETVRQGASLPNHASPNDQASLLDHAVELQRRVVEIQCQVTDLTQRAATLLYADGSAHDNSESDRELGTWLLMRAAELQRVAAALQLNTEDLTDDAARVFAEDMRYLDPRKVRGSNSRKPRGETAQTARFLILKTDRQSLSVCLNPEKH